MNLEITQSQYSALMDIYGPPENIHFMIIDSTLTNKGKYILEGEAEDFEDLISLIGEEIGEGMCSKTNGKALLRICRKIDPDTSDWIV